jgi:hypothetical protein
LTTSSSLGLIAALAPLLPLAIGLYNRLTWPRPTPSTGGPAIASVSVLVPARNEAGNIRSCLEAVLAQGDAVREVLVYSDESADETEAIVRSIARVDQRVRLLVGTGLPQGWVGKPHACHELGRQAEAPWLLFLDADVRLAKGAVAGLMAGAKGGQPSVDADVVSLVPRQTGGDGWLDLLQPLLLLTYVSWLPLAWANRSTSPRFLAGCGQVLLVSKSAFGALGGFAAVRAAVVDDLEFCRRARQRGARVVFLDGHELATCQMYDGLGSFWRGFAKNVFLGLGSELNLAVALGLHATCFVLPYVLLAYSLLSSLWGEAQPSEVPMLAASGVIANLIHRTVLARRHCQRAWSVVVHPLAVLVLMVLALDSWRRVRLVGVEWSGRRYQGGAA